MSRCDQRVIGRFVQQKKNSKNSLTNMKSEKSIPEVSGNKCANYKQNKGTFSCQHTAVIARKSSVSLCFMSFLPFYFFSFFVIYFECFQCYQVEVDNIDSFV